MMRYALFAVAAAFVVSAAPVENDPVQPHLAQAWQAMSTGDGIQGQTGLESYIYQKGGDGDGTIRAHKWDYGADTCIKYDVDGGFSNPWTGLYYVACDSVDCCVDDSAGNQVPDVKQWDIPKKNLFTQVAFTGFHDTTELNNKPVKHAETWFAKEHIPFTKVGVNYSYYISREENGNTTDIVTHRIDYGAPQQGVDGSILYGNFTVIQPKDIDTFKNTFAPPAACLKANVLSCDEKQLKKWNMKYFKHEAARRGWF